jgi:hypothetical protein
MSFGRLHFWKVALLKGFVSALYDIAECYCGSLAVSSGISMASWL